jgi:hypothetical protein
MKFAFSKLSVLAALAAATVLSGCGLLNFNNSKSPALSSGNWSFVATSTVSPAQISDIGGSLSLNGSTVTSTMHSNLNCFDTSAPFSFGGTLQNHQITFTSAPNANNQVITVIASVTSPTAITGTYTVTSGGGCAPDQGTITASLVPSIKGTWQGPIAFGGTNVTLAIALSQASSASADGTYALTGNLTYTNSGCSKSGTLGSSYLAGSMLVIDGTTVEVDNTAGSFSLTNVTLNSPFAPGSFTGTYKVISGMLQCAGDSDTPTFTKQ